MQKGTFAIGVVGPRPPKYRMLQRTDVAQDLDRQESEKNVDLIAKIVEHLENKYGPRQYFIVTIGCDQGFGKDLKSYCIANNVRMAELTVMLRGATPEDPFGSSVDFARVFMARYAYLLELCHEFHIKLPEAKGLINGLVDRVQDASEDKAYYIYDFENSMLEFRGDALTPAFSSLDQQ